jgi:membrane-bound serine protease (ClpP class)
LLPTIYVPLWLLVIIIILVVVFIVFAVIWSVRAHRNRVTAGKEDLIGSTAVVETALDPKGIVLVEGEHWTAVIDNGRAEPGEDVIIRSVQGLKLTVSKKVQEVVQV